MTAVNIHASCILLARAGEAFAAPADAGVLLLGNSGAGKSDVALQLIARGAVLVADDRVELFDREGTLWARPARALAGLIEARGLGIVSLPHAPEARVALAVRLVPAGDVSRFPERHEFEPSGPLSILPEAHPPLVILPARDASTPTKIVLAAAAFANALFREKSNPL